MNRKAKKDASIFSKGMIWRIIYQGVMVGGLTLCAFAIGCKFNFDLLQDESIRMTAQTMAFAVLAISQLVHALNVRSNKESLFKVGLGTNKVLLLADFVSLLLMVLVLCVPGMQTIFEVTTLSLENWLWVGALSIAPLVIVEVFKMFKINTLKNEE